MCDPDNSDEDYDFISGAHPHPAIEKKYPIHDCCEFDDVETLKELIYMSTDDDSDEDEDDDTDESSHDVRGIHETKDDSSSTDENDSTAAAHAAAIGHSPQPLKQTLLDKSMNLNPSSSLDTISKDNDIESPEEVRSSQNVIINGSTVTSEEIPDADTSKNYIADSPVGSSEEKKVAKAEDIPLSPATTALPLDPQPMEVSEKEDNNDSTKVDDSTPPIPEEPQKINGTSLTKFVATKQTSPKLKRRRIDPNVMINERDDDENTPIHIAIHSRKLDHVRVLLEARASCRLKCDGSYPVHTAISLGSIRPHRQFAYDCFVLLHEHGADLSVKDDSIHTPLYLACMFNHPQIVSYILSYDDGLATLNTRADRAGNRPLHAAAKFDTLENPSFSKAAAASATGHARVVNNHHPDGSVINSMHSIPGFRGKVETLALRTGGTLAADSATAAGAPSTEALLTQLLLSTQGIEIDATNVVGQTPLHIACFRGNWSAARLLLQAGADPHIADRRGHTPGQLAYKRAMPIPNDLTTILGDPPEKGCIPPLRDLILDPNGPTLLFSHELCILHRTCPPIRRDSPEPPPENVRRLQVLLDKETGILRSGEFTSLTWVTDCRRAAISDVLKVHEYAYVEKVSEMTSAIPDHPSAIAHLDADTAVSRWSFEAAMRAAGSMCQAVDRVVAGECRNAFCAVRPPGHHAGPRGIVKCANDIDGGSHGFCLLNNVAIGAAYARSMYRNEGIKKVAIVDFDVHHGNGTEAIIRNLVPTTEKATIRTPFAFGELTTTTYRPWLDETDIKNVFFASTHGYGNRGYDQPGWFYPASGKTHISEAITHPAMIENPSLGDFILSQTWARMGEESLLNCCKVINVGLALPDPDSDLQSRSMKQRLELRDTFRKNILPKLRDFDPDIIFISAGFDGHKKDTMNFGYVGMVEDDYEWITEQLIKVANTCCNGRVISVLEGGYKMHGGIVSPFARSAASHIRALVDGGRSRELYDAEDCESESQFERHLFERRERRREQEREHLRSLEESTNRRIRLDQWPTHGDIPDDPDAPIDSTQQNSRKRRRNQVNYKELFKQMQQEGFAG